MNEEKENNMSNSARRGYSAVAVKKDFQLNFDMATLIRIYSDTLGKMLLYVICN